MDINELNAAITEADKELDTTRAEHEERYKSLRAYLKDVLERNICKQHATVTSVHDSAATVQVGSRCLHTIDLYFEKPWDDECKDRKLKINFGCFGSFSKDDADEVKYCETLGHLAGIMDVLQNELFERETAVKLWSAYDESRRKVWSAREKSEKLKSELKKIQDEAKRQEILSKIVPGRRVMVKRATLWAAPVIKTIERLMPVNFTFKEDYGKRTNRDVLISNLVSGAWLLA